MAHKHLEQLAHGLEALGFASAGGAAVVRQRQGAHPGQRLPRVGAGQGLNEVGQGVGAQLADGVGGVLRQRGAGSGGGGMS